MQKTAKYSVHDVVFQILNESINWDCIRTHDLCLKIVILLILIY